MHALSNLAPFRAAHEFFSLAGGDGAPQKKGCILDPILQDTVGPNASAKIDQPPAWRTLLSIEKPNRKERPIEERPGGRVRSADSFSPQGWGERVTVAHESESASGGPALSRVTILGPRCSAQSALAALSKTCSVKGSGV